MRVGKLWPEELDVYSSKIGNNRALTQGPGGNTSLKSGSVLWIKASGFHLSDAELAPIFCLVNRTNPRVSISDSKLQPSIESYLHASIPHPAVIHAHSLGSIALGIRKSLKMEHRKMLKEHNLGYLPYVKPGENLGRQVLQLIEKDPLLQGTVLKNHGIVLWGDELESLYQSLLKIEEAFYMELGIDPNGEVSSELRTLLRNVGFLTPDHAVFGDLLYSQNHHHHSWISDLEWCLALALGSIKVDETIDSLNQQEIIELISWDLERARKLIKSE